MRRSKVLDERRKRTHRGTELRAFVTNIRLPSLLFEQKTSQNKIMAIKFGRFENTSYFCRRYYLFFKLYTYEERNN